MDLVKRYIAAVQRNLPEARQQEIGRELQANILDELDALKNQHGELTNEQVAGVLRQMGSPRTVARQFAPLRPLIDLDYMPLYQYTLFMVLGLLFLLQVMDSTIAWLSNESMGLVDYLRHLARGYLQHAMFGFTTITLGFWFMSRQRTTTTENCKSDWQPETLPPVGAHWQHISLQDIFTDLATWLFLLIVIWYPVLTPQEQWASSRFIFSDNAHRLMLWASPLVLLGMANNLWQLRHRLWTHRMLLCNIALNSVLVLVILMLAASDPLLQLETNRWEGVFDLAQLERAAMISLIIVALFPLWEVGRDVLRLKRGWPRSQLMD